MLIGGGNGENAVGGVGGGIEWRSLVVAVVIPGACDEKNSCPLDGDEGTFEGGAVGEATVGVAKNAKVHSTALHGQRIVEHGENIRKIPRSITREGFKRHDLHVPIDAWNAAIIIPDGADRAGAVGAMVVVVHGVGAAVLMGDTEPVGVIRVAVAVVVDAVSRDVTGICPHIRCEVRVVAVDACVDNAHHDGA